MEDAAKWAFDAAREVAAGRAREVDGAVVRPLTADLRAEVLAEELARLDDLRERVESGAREGHIDGGSAVTMLINISRARVDLVSRPGGVR